MPDTVEGTWKISGVTAGGFWVFPNARFNARINENKIRIYVETSRISKESINNIIISNDSSNLTS